MVGSIVVLGLLDTPQLSSLLPSFGTSGPNMASAENPSDRQDFSGFLSVNVSGPSPWCLEGVFSNATKIL